jgi:hypothetical protein
MNESGKNQFVLKKAYEIAYAIFRIAANIAEPAFGEQLKEQAILLIGSAAQERYEAMPKNLAALEYFVRFSMDVNIMGTTNGEVLLKEIRGLSAALPEVAEAKEASLKNEVDIAGIFSNSDVEENPAIRQEPEQQNEIIRQSNPAIESGNDAHEHIEESGNASLKAAIRQETILERIRQSGNCRIKDIQDVLPGTSERTIRYDLQSLVEKNLVERVGSGGPSVFYRVTFREEPAL